MIKSKFKPGDKVRIVGYGHPIWQNKHVPDPKLPFPVIKEDEDMVWKDMLPELVGQEGVVEGSYAHLYGASSDRDYHKYSLNGIAGKSAWYDEQQLESII